jgi:phosphoserine aminotransferase
MICENSHEQLDLCPTLLVHSSLNRKREDGCEYLVFERKLIAMHRIYNFSPGPAILPVSVLEEASKAVLELNGSGMSVLEVSHRGKWYDPIHLETKEAILRILGLSSDEYVVMFIQGGASLQFAMLPLNFLAEGRVADYVNAGEWGGKAYKEAKRVGKGIVNEIASSADKKFSYIPKNYTVTPGAQYLHVTTNNTIEGTELFDLPETGGAALVADASSDIFAVNRDHSKFDLIYAGAQKNAGPAGVTLVVARKSFLEKAVSDLPLILAYKTFSEKDSLFNTPPVFSVYVAGLVVKWVEAQGGIKAVEAVNRKKAELLYNAVDSLSDFYEPAVTAVEDRSLMNIPFRLRPAYAELEKEFLSLATAAGLDGLKGHRSVGGFRASIYNAFPLEGVEALVQFIKDFAAKKG